MGQTGIFDVFQAAIGASGAVLDELDKQNRLKAEMEVQDAALKDKEAFHQFMLDMENSSDWQNYEARWDDFKMRVHNDTTKGLSSPFARRVYDAHYKNTEMEQRLMIKTVAQKKMRAEDFTKGFDYIGNVITSRSFADTEAVNEDGVAYTKTATQQKKELIDQKLYMMHEAGLLSYEQLNQSLRDSYASLMKHEMVTAGKQSVDEGKSIEEVTSKIQEYKNEFVTAAGGRVSEEAVKDTASEEIKRYFYEQQAIRYKNGEQGASRIYRKMSDALAKGNWDEAYSAADEGREYLREWDEKYGGNGFDANVRDEYSDKFMLKDDVKIAGKYGGLARMEVKDEVNFWLFAEKHGGFIDKDGKTIRLKHSESINYILNDVLQAKTKVLGKEKAMAKTYELLASLDNAIYKPPFCNEGVSASVKNVDGAVKALFEQRKDFNTPEGQATYIRALGEIKGQVHDYIARTPVNEQTPEAVQDIFVAGVLRVSGGAEIGDYWTSNERKQAQDAARIARMVANEKKKGVYGDDLSSPEAREGQERLRNIAVESIRQIENLTSNDAVLEKYQIDVLDDGRTVAIDRKTKDQVHLFGFIENEKGEEEYRRHAATKNADSTYRYTADDKRPSEMQKQKQAEENKTRAFTRNMDTIGVRERKGTYKQEEASEAFRAFVMDIPSHDQALFKQIRDDYGSRSDFKTGEVSNDAQEKRIIDAFKKGKTALQEFEETGKARIPYGIREDLLSFYDSLKTEYQKLTLIEAYKYARKHPERSGISLATALERYSELKKERQLTGGEPLTSPLYRKVKNQGR